MNGLKVKAATHFVIVFAFFNQQILLLGPPLPEPLCYHQMVSWDTNLVVLGGGSSMARVICRCLSPSLLSKFAVEVELILASDWLTVPEQFNFDSKFRQ